MSFSRQLIICRRYYIPILRHPFFRNSPSKLKSIGMKLYTWRRFRWNAPCKLLASSAQRAQNGAKNPHFPIFLSPKQGIVSRTFQFSWNLNTIRELVGSRILSEQKCKIFPITDLPPKLHFYVFDTLPVRAPWPWPLGLRRIWALHLIVEGLKRVFAISCFRDIGVQTHIKFRKLCKISLYFGCRYSVGSLDSLYILHIWQRGRSNGGVALTVTSGDLDLLCDLDTHLTNGLRSLSA